MNDRASEEEFDALLEYLKDPESDDVLREVVDEVGVRPVLPQGLDAWMDQQTAKMTAMIHPPWRHPYGRKSRPLAGILELAVSVVLCLLIGVWMMEGLTLAHQQTVSLSTANISQKITR
ncbi:hypothetical protein [Dinghuibacter silviterrae]|nr:hypothetical protein [Dinghuibacter silviterrae]